MIEHCFFYFGGIFRARHETYPPCIMDYYVLGDFRRDIVLGYFIYLEEALHFVNHNSTCGESSLHLSSIFLFPNG
jgi:hypothetical protein